MNLPLTPKNLANLKAMEAVQTNTSFEFQLLDLFSMSIGYKSQYCWIKGSIKQRQGFPSFLHNEVNLDNLVELVNDIEIVSYNLKLSKALQLEWEKAD